MLQLDLPFPPTVNKYYRNVGGRTLISREGRAYRERVCWLLRGRVPAPLDVPLEVSVVLYPPDRRRFDVDNRLKALLDALQHAGVYQDDCLIVKLAIEKRETVRAGKAIVVISQWREAGDGSTPSCPGEELPGLARRCRAGLGEARQGEDSSIATTINSDCSPDRC